jgi:hypothetical protein
MLCPWNSLDTRLRWEEVLTHSMLANLLEDRFTLLGQFHGIPHLMFSKWSVTSCSIGGACLGSMRVCAQESLNCVLDH